MLKIALFIYLFIAAIVTKANDSLYTALSAMIAEDTKSEVIANNIANKHTIGYESDQVLIDVRKIYKRNGQYVILVKPYSIHRNHKRGDIRITGRNLDIAIVSNRGYFQYLTPRGKRYSLNGQLSINANGVLVDDDNMPISSISDREISIPNMNSNLINKIFIDQNGVIFCNDQIVDTIGIYDIPNAQVVLRDGKYYISKGVQLMLTGFTIANRSLMESNVDLDRDLLRMQNARNRSYTLTQIVAALNKVDKFTVDTLLR